jgi:hypothetical protein
VGWKTDSKEKQGEMELWQKAEVNIPFNLLSEFATKSCTYYAELLVND